MLKDRYGREIPVGGKIAVFEPVIVAGAPWEVVSIEESLLAGHPKGTMKMEIRTVVTLFQPSGKVLPSLVNCVTPEELEIFRAEQRKPRTTILS